MTGVALVGCAHIHTPRFAGMLRARDDIHVIAVWDHDRERAASNADVHAAADVRDLAAIWTDEQIVAVVICAETDRHPALIRAAVDAGKHMFVEKPLAIAGSEARELAAMIGSSGLTFSTGFFLRGRAMLRYLRDQLAAGTFGTLTRVDMSVSHEGALAGWFDTEWRWMTDPRQAGYGALGDLGTHAVDLILWLIGGGTRPRSATAWTGTASGRYGPIDEFGRGQLQFDDGMVASIWASWADLANPVELVVSGTDAHAAIIDGQLTMRRRDSAGGAVEVPELPPDTGHAFELFLDAISGDRSAALVTPSEAARCAVIIEALYRSARGGDPVVIDQD